MKLQFDFYNKLEDLTLWRIYTLLHSRRNFSNAAQIMRSTAYSLDDVLSKIVDHHRHTKQIGPARCHSSADMQSDGKDNKKKGDKSAEGNQAIKEGDTSSTKCQLCSHNHSATLFQELRKQSAANRRGALFPGKLDKDCKRKGAKALDSSKETGEKPCMLIVEKFSGMGFTQPHHARMWCNLLNSTSRKVGKDSMSKVHLEFNEIISPIRGRSHRGLIQIRVSLQSHNISITMLSHLVIHLRFQANCRCKRG